MALFATSQRFAALTLAALVVAGSSFSLFAAPSLSNVTPRGLQSGGATVLAFDGAGLTGDVKLLASFPIAGLEVLPGGAANKVQVRVTLDAAVAPGMYQVRLASPTGVSNALPLAIDGLVQLPFAAEIAALPVALTGDLTGATVLRTSFAGTKGQRIVLDVEGRRLGSNLRPVLRLYDARGTQLTWSPPRPALGDDARCDMILPADGTYTVEIHDLLYRGASPGVFRLKIGELKYADFVLPLAAKRGANVSLEPAGGNLPADFRAAAVASSLATYQPAGLAASSGLVGPQPQLLVSDDEEALETAPADPKVPQTVAAAPVGISGRLAAPGEEDRYLVPVAPGTKLRIEVVAERLGSPIDAVLSVRGPQGNQLAGADDLPNTTDAGVDFTVPAGMEQIQVAVKDMVGRGGPDFVYHLEVFPAAQPDFSLNVDSDRIQLSAGATALVRVVVDRDGYTGPIALSVPGLPSNVTVTSAEIPAGAAVGLVALTAAADASGAGLFQIVGTSGDPAVKLARVAEAPETGANRMQPWLRTELAYGVSGKAKLEVAWANPTDADKLLLGGKYEARAAIKRADGVQGAVRISLITNQVVPKKAPAKPAKGRKPAPPADDIERTIRVEGMPTAAAGANEVAANILAPLDLPPGQPWDLVLRADLLAADGQRVIGSAWSPVRRFGTRSQLSLELATAPSIEAKAGDATPIKLTGKIVRVPGFALPVSVTVTGLPKEVPAPKVDLAADKTDFELAIAFPANAPPGDVANVKLIATATPDGAKPNLQVRSNEIPLTVKIQAKE